MCRRLNNPCLNLSYAPLLLFHRQPLALLLCYTNKHACCACVFVFVSIFYCCKMSNHFSCGPSAAFCLPSFLLINHYRPSCVRSWARAGERVLEIGREGVRERVLRKHSGFYAKGFKRLCCCCLLFLLLLRIFDA